MTRGLALMEYTYDVVMRRPRSVARVRCSLVVEMLPLSRLLNYFVASLLAPKYRVIKARLGLFLTLSPAKVPRPVYSLLLCCFVPGCFSHLAVAAAAGVTMGAWGVLGRPRKGNI